VGGINSDACGAHYAATEAHQQTRQPLKNLWKLCK